MSFAQFSTFEGKVQHDVKLVDKEGEKTGEINFETELVWIEDVPEKEVFVEDEDIVEIEPPVEKVPAVPHPEINGKSCLRITIKEATVENFSEDTNHFIDFLYQQTI